MSKKLKNIGIVSLLTAVSRVLGLVRDLLSAAIFGTSERTKTVSFWIVTVNVLLTESPSAQLRVPEAGR